MSMRAPLSELPLFAPEEPRPRGRDEWAENERRVYQVISNHKGRANAISAVGVADAVGVTRRTVEAIVNKLVRERGKIICSAQREPSGYYLPASAEERREAGEFLIEKGFEMVKRGRELGAIAKAEVVARLQTELLA